MLLAVDVGNSNTVLGVFAGGELGPHWRVSTEPHRTPDEVALTLQGLLAFADLSLVDDLDGIVIASVVPPVTETYREMAHRHLDTPPVVVEPGTRTGIDFGTATSFDAVDRDGAFVGGAIAPGVRVSTDALADHAARLPKVEIVLPPEVVGRTTVSALQSGIVHGFAGQVDTIVRRLCDELGPGVTTVATGGLAGTVLESCETIDHHDPWLTLKGLRLIWERNT